MSLSKGNMVWNDEANAKLLLAFLKVSEVKANFEALAKELCTDEVTCTPRAVQEHLKKLRKVVGAGPTTPSKSNTTTTTTTPVKAPRKKAAATLTSCGVKKTRKPAGGKGKKGSSVNVDDAEDVPTKMEPNSDSDNGGQPPSKKRKYEETTEGPGNVGGGESIGSESADVAQDDLDELLSA